MQPLFKALTISLFFSSLCFADSVCENLCGFCVNKAADSTCIKTDSLCHCAAILDSIPQIQDSVATTNNVKQDSIEESKLPSEMDSLQNISQDSAKKTKMDRAEEPMKPATFKKADKIYTGFALTYGKFDPVDYMGYDGNINDDNREGGFTWLFRWYLHKAISFQTGLGVFYNYSTYSITYRSFSYSYDLATLRLHEFSIEVPFEFKLEYPVTQNFAPFLSFSFNVRKPIHGWVDYGDANTTHSMYSNDAYSSSEWEFVGWFGIGVDIAKRFALELQWMMFEGSTGIARDYEGAWRLNMQVTW